MNTLQQSRTEWTPFGNGQQPSEGIPRALRQCLETLMRCDLSAVRLRTDPSLASLDVLAAASGDRIHFSPQAPSLATPAGITILGHELAHVVQQRQGRVQAPSDGPVVVADAALEREADAAGRHCAAAFFPGLIADPGWPEALGGGAPSRDTAARTPVQFVVSAQQSFEDILLPVFEQLATDYGKIDRSACETKLAALCYNYRSNKVPQKVPLVGVPYCEAMNALLGVTKDYVVRVQGLGKDDWPYLQLDRTPLTEYFTNWGIAITKDSFSPKLPKIPSAGVKTSKEAVDGTTGSMDLPTLNKTYLHVFLKDAKAIPITWRICLNICPKGILDAVAAIAPMMSKYPCIAQIKFAVPTVSNKADSVIAYMNAEQETFSSAREEIQKLGASLLMQPRVGAMLDEIADGIGEGAEPPSDGFARPYYASFTQVRCRVFYTAFRWMVETVEESKRSFSAFVNVLNPVMPCLGLDPIKPQIQRVYDLWTTGKEANHVRELYLA